MERIKDWMSAVCKERCGLNVELQCPGGQATFAMGSYPLKWTKYELHNDNEKIYMFQCTCNGFEWSLVIRVRTLAYKL
jgi:hypothetical protein